MAGHSARHANSFDTAVYAPCNPSTVPDMDFSDDANVELCKTNLHMVVDSCKYPRSFHCLFSRGLSSPGVRELEVRDANWSFFPGDRWIRYTARRTAVLEKWWLSGPELLHVYRHCLGF